MCVVAWRLLGNPASWLAVGTFPVIFASRSRVSPFCLSPARPNRQFFFHCDRSKCRSKLRNDTAQLSDCQSKDREYTVTRTLGKLPLYLHYFLLQNPTSILRYPSIYRPSKRSAPRTSSPYFLPSPFIHVRTAKRHSRPTI